MVYLSALPSPNITSLLSHQIVCYEKGIPSWLGFCDKRKAPVPRLNKHRKNIVLDPERFWNTGR